MSTAGSTLIETKRTSSSVIRRVRLPMLVLIIGQIDGQLVKMRSAIHTFPRRLSDSHSSPS